MDIIKNKWIKNNSNNKVLESIKWLKKDKNNIVKKELDWLLSTLDGEVEVEYMINWEVYWFQWSESEQLFYTKINTESRLKNIEEIPEMLRIIEKDLEYEDWELDRYFIVESNTESRVKIIEEIPEMLGLIEKDFDLEKWELWRYLIIESNMEKYESKSTQKVIDLIFDDKDYREYDIYEALHNLSIEKKDVIKILLTEEIVSSRDDVEYNEDIEHLDIKQLIEEYYEPNSLIKELWRIHNNFFSIWKWSILNKESILKITEDIQEYWEEMTSKEKEIGAYFIVTRAGEYNHSFIKIDINTYECIFTYSPE